MKLDFGEDNYLDVVNEVSKNVMAIINFCQNKWMPCDTDKDIDN